MKTFQNKIDLEEYLKPLKQNQKVGLVPTMGALHEGHLSLIKASLYENAATIVSIFVNPTQFDKKEDLTNYPRTLEQDLKLLKTLKNDSISVYAPTVSDIYNDAIISQSFSFGGIEHQMEGAFRDGHFDGVGTIVKKLLEIVEPNNAYFGEKDFQQLQIVKKLTQLHNIPVNIIGCPIFREDNGLAMSSRNARLTPEHKDAAPFIYKILTTAKEKFGTKSAKKVSEWVNSEFSKHPLLELEYFTIADIKTLKSIKRKSSKKNYRAFIAVYAGNIRLIDNIALN